MGRPVSLQTLGEAARRARRVGPPRPAPVRPRGLFRSFPVRVSLLGLLVLVLVPFTVTPARGFVDAVAAGKVIAQMGTLIGQMAAIKGVVEEQRQQARAALFGKLLPLASKMRTANCFLAHANGLRLGFDQCLDNGDPDPLRYELPDGQEVLDHIDFNRPIDVCADQTGVNCYDAPVTADEVRSVGDVVRNITRDAYTSQGGVYPQYAADRHARQARGFDEIADSVATADEGFERRMARQRAIVEGGMSVVEEWRGCQDVPEGATVDPDDPRLPCMTNLGNGPGGPGGSGTVGMVQELGAQLKLIEDAQEGDASKTQLATISTQVGIMQARISAAMLELSAVAAEAGQQAQLEAEAGVRRRQELFRLRMDCLDGRMGHPAHPFNVFYPNRVGPADGVCVPAPVDGP